MAADLHTPNLIIPSSYFGLRINHLYDAVPATYWTAVQRFYCYTWDNRSLAIVTCKEAERQVTPAGNACKVIEQWLVRASTVSCTESADHTWTCQLNRSGKQEWIVGNSQGNRRFDVPAAWHMETVTPLLHDRVSLTGASIDIGPVPMLLTSQS